MSVLSSIIGWLRAGYPAGVPEQDYVPLLALLGRRLSDDEVDEVRRALRHEGLAPASRVDVGVGITRVTDELPTQDEIERVMHRLEAIGYPVLDADFERLTDNVVEIPGGFAVARVRPPKALDVTKLVDLYEAVGWSAYTAEPERLHRAIRRSDRVVCAWDAERRMVGLARSLSDRETICYVQDVLVRPEVQRRGIGRALVERLLREYPDIRQTVLLTDADTGLRGFYRALGFREPGEHEPPLAAFIQIR